MSRATPRRLLPAGLAAAVLLTGCGGDTSAEPPAGPAAASPQATSTGTGTQTTPAASSAAPSASGRGALVGVFEVTCHTGPGVTASGRPSSREVVSVDRALFPFGTRLYIDQVGVRVAADTGPAMVGRRLDIWEPSAQACTAFGRKRLQVWRQP